MACLENSMDRGACWATDQGITKSQTRLNTHTLFRRIFKDSLDFEPLSGAQKTASFSQFLPHTHQSAKASSLTHLNTHTHTHTHTHTRHPTPTPSLLATLGTDIKVQDQNKKSRGNTVCSVPTEDACLPIAPVTGRGLNPLHCSSH